jgi:hypothetical protein
MRIGRALVVLLVLGSSGCHAFMPTSSVSPGETARVTLNVMRPMNDGTQLPIHIEGVVVSSSLGAPGSGTGFIALQQSSLRTFGEVSTVTYDTMRVSGADIGRLERRKVSWVKTGIVGVLTGGMAYLLLDRISDAVEVSPGSGG